MAKIDIRGTECTFPCIPQSTLQCYGPQPDTHLLLWKTKDRGMSLYMAMHLTMLQTIKAIDRLVQFELEGGARAALFDYTCASTRLLRDLENYSRIIFGTQYTLVCPWRLARNEGYKHELDVIWAMDRNLIELYRKKVEDGTLRHRLPEFRAMVNAGIHSEQERDGILELMAMTEGRHNGTIEACEAITHLTSKAS